MDAQRWRHIGEIFDAVADALPEQRDKLLDKLCAGDAGVRGEVEALLRADALSTAFDRGVDSARRRTATEWADASESAPADARVGPWRVLRELGRGGMGVVLLAERADGAFEQFAALKLVKRGMDSDAMLARFLRERQILACLQHPHIAHLLDGGISADGRPYFAMEYVDGAPLLSWCAEKNARLEERISIFLDICAAVQFAHGRLIVHRDIKPSNILITAAGEAKLLDFGIAALIDGSGAAGATIDAINRPLTPAYAAPEQLRGEPATTASDIYALGCLLYELLTARRPLATSEAPTLEEMRRVQETTDPAAPSRIADAPVPARRLRGDLDTIVLKALQREPQRRYATAEALAADLRRFLDGRPIAARRDNAAYRTRKFVARHRAGVGLTTLAALSLLLALYFAVCEAFDQARAAQESAEVTRFLSGLFQGADPTLARGATISAQYLLDQGSERLRANTHMQPLVRARLLHAIAGTYDSLGLYDRALAQEQQALDLRGGSSRDTLDTAESLTHIGRILREKGEYAQAGPPLRKALGIRRAKLAADDPALIDSLGEVGALLRAQGKFKDADSFFNEALQAAEHRYGADAVETARRLDDRAANLDDLGQTVDAEAAYRRALAMREKLLGPDDAEVATSLQNLGVHLDDTGNSAAAVPLLERAVAIRKKIFGPAHPLVGMAELALAGVYESQERLDDSEHAAQDALSIFRKTLPDDHPKISETLNLLALLRMLRHDYAGAIPLMRDVLKRFARSDGENHPDTITAKENLAFALEHAGQLAEAERLFREALQSVTADNGQSSTATALQNLASTLEEEGQFADAVRFSKESVAVHKRREGEVSKNVAVALRQLAYAEELNGEADAAEKDFRAALAMGETVRQARKVAQVYEWKVPLADFLAGRDRCDEALPLLHDAQEEIAHVGQQQLEEWPLQTRLLLGHCLTVTHQPGGAEIERAARAELRALPHIEMSLEPTVRKLLQR